jgi:phosphate transport system substrate-binding protein
MKGIERFTALAVLAAGLLAASAAYADIVKIDGSSTVFPVTEAVAEDFQKSSRGKYRVTVGISGTGGGFKKFCRGETDISDASRPISVKEMKACNEAGIRYIELPVAFDALTVVVNPKNTFLRQLTLSELKKMWEPAAQGKITNWNQVNTSLPDAPLKLFGAGADSGTFDYFTEAVTGKSKSSRGDFTASEDDNVLVQGVSRDVNALGFFGFAYYVENQDKLKAVPIVNDKGKAVAPSMAAVEEGAYNPLARQVHAGEPHRRWSPGRHRGDARRHARPTGVHRRLGGPSVPRRRHLRMGAAGGRSVRRRDPASGRSSGRVGRRRRVRGRRHHRTE